MEEIDISSFSMNYIMLSKHVRLFLLSEDMNYVFFTNTSNSNFFYRIFFKRMYFLKHFTALKIVVYLLRIKKIQLQPLRQRHIYSLTQ